MSTSYVLGSAVRWDDQWMWEHNIAHALAASHPLLFVDPPISPLTALRGQGQDRRALLRRRTLEGRLSVVRPLALPPLTNAAAERASAPFLRRQLSKAARSSGIERPVLLSARPWKGLEGAVGERLRVQVVHDWFEAGGELFGLEGRDLGADMDAACAASDLVIATSRRLVEGLAGRGHRAELLLHGFHDDLKHLYDATPAPPEYGGLPRPLLGYTGTIDARLDFGLLEALAERFGAIALVGPVSPRAPKRLDRLAALPNVHLLGLKPREALPAYIAHLDVALLPYREDEWGRYGSPLKLWDYLYAGPPIVGSGYLELQDFPPPLVRFASGIEAFVDAVAEELETGAAGRNERRRFALDNTWAARARRLDELVEGSLPT